MKTIKGWSESDSGAETFALMFKEIWENSAISSEENSEKK